MGLDEVGFTALDGVEHPRLREWLAAGRHAGMQWLARTAHLRARPREAFPWACSAIVVLKVYRTRDDDSVTGREPTPDMPAYLGVARYARAKDYHRFLLRDLRRLAKALEKQFPGHRFVARTDTAPLPERLLARAAGLGWIGRNTMLLHPALGSYTWIGVILTDLRLQADRPPVRFLCGRCQRCVEACPTDALRDGELDARRCISYWTIEHRGPLPPGLNLSGWWFGCDICQEVCPWNRKAARSRDPRLRVLGVLRGPLSGILRMSEEEFQEAFQGSPIRRAKYSGIQRNLGALWRRESDGSAVVAGTQGDPEAGAKVR